MLKLLHGADFHLDSPFSGLTPEQAAQRRAEQRQLLDELAQLARQRQVELVLLSGDLLDSQRVYRETAQALARALGNIPCPVFIAPGNHDPFTEGSPYATLPWPDNVHIFRDSAITGVALPELNCTVYGRAFTSPYYTVSPLAQFSPKKDDTVKLMCLHGDVASQSNYAPITPADIAASGLDYLALGHIHQASGLRREGNTFWSYPGCPEGRGFDELGEKGLCYVEVSPGHVTSEFIPLGRHSYRILPVDITAREPMQAILAALPDNTQDDIYRILLTGQANPPHLPRLESALAGRFYHLSLRDCTRLPQDLWARREEDTLTGLFLRSMWEKCQAEPDNQTYQLAVRFALAALENGEDVAP